MALNCSWWCRGWCRDIIRESFEAECHRATVVCSASDPIYIAQLSLRIVYLWYSGLQGSYNAYSEKRGFRVPHGDVLVFALS